MTGLKPNLIYTSDCIGVKIRTAERESELVLAAKRAYIAVRAKGTGSH
jgi:hypothetical protein